MLKMQWKIRKTKQSNDLQLTALLANTPLSKQLSCYMHVFTLTSKGDENKVKDPVNLYPCSYDKLTLAESFLVF